MVTRFNVAGRDDPGKRDDATFAPADVVPLQ
jgi:hypothetical protein